MSLRLRQAIPGRPSSGSAQGLSAISLGDKQLVVYPSSSNVVILDSSLELHETLQFWSALPQRASSSSRTDVQGVFCSSTDKLIIAWARKHIVCWQNVISKGNAQWAVHSTLHLTSPITSLDFTNGNLAVATTGGIELWRLDPKSEIVVWDRLWERSHPNATRVILSPSITNIAWYTQGEKSVHVVSLDRKGEVSGAPQEIRQPRDITWIGWRKPSTPNPDSHLYIITANSVFRIYSPVLDDPTWFQLLHSFDSRSFAVGHQGSFGTAGTLSVIDADVLHKSLGEQLDRLKGSSDVDTTTIKTIEQLHGEEGDIVLWLGEDGALGLRSISNIDRAPPTLLKSTCLAFVKIPNISFTQWSPSVIFIPSPQGIFAAVPAQEATSITAYNLSIPDLVASSPTCINPVLPTSGGRGSYQVHFDSIIDYFVRTPNGRGLLATTESGEIGVWYKEAVGQIPSEGPVPRSVTGKGYWKEKAPPATSAIFAKGRGIVFYTKEQIGGKVTLQHLENHKRQPAPPVDLPDFELEMQDDIAFLLAVSDIDDGYSNRGRHTQRAIIIAASKQGSAWVWRVDSKLSEEGAWTNEPPDIKLISHYTLPVEGGEPHLILPVDPMGWHESVIDWKNDSPLQDLILTVSKSGVLEFWTPELGHHFAGERPHSERLDARGHLRKGANGECDKPWKRTGFVRTERKRALMARCSSRKKTVLVCECDGGTEVTIWDSKVSEFSTGLELVYIFPEKAQVQDLDWTTTSDLQSVLAVGLPHQVVLVCEQRLSYTESTPGWAPFLSIDLEQYTSVPISDSIWLAGGSLAVGAGNQIYVFSRFLDPDAPIRLPQPLADTALAIVHNDQPEDLFQLIAWRNGPLLDYHPTVLSQSLLWGKVELVKAILLKLVDDLKEADIEEDKRLVYKRLDPTEFFATRKAVKQVEKDAARKYDGLFDTTPSTPVEDDDDDYSPRVVSELVDYLEGPIVIPLTPNEKAQLGVVAQATLDLELERRSLDDCGARYLLSILMAVNQHKRSGANTPINGYTTPQPELKISFRNFVWALHSESQEMMLTEVTATCPNGKMLWEDAKRLGVFLWLKSTETVKSQLEVIARNRFMADDDRDPTACSLIFFALGRKKVLHGLWKQAPGHKEQNMMLKFLANDFELDRWKTAAVKNAYALLSKGRYEYAAAFFMLGGCLKDAVTVCVRQLQDWQLGYAIARVVEGSTEAPVSRWVLTDTVVPLAMTGGHRWLATWAFWQLGRRDLAVRVLISPMTDVAIAWTPDDPLPVGISENDDPSLLLLFQHLKSKSLQTAKGTSEVPEKTEFDFVLNNARVFFRMGCHALGLDLLHSWSFERPFFPSPKPYSRSETPSISERPSMPPSRQSNRQGTLARPVTRRPSFMLSQHGRRPSMVMDMEDPSGEAISPEASAPRSALDEYMTTTSPRVSSTSLSGPDNGASAPEASIQEESEEFENGTPVVETPRPMSPVRKGGNLMKEIKGDSQQGAMEFDMSNFF